jgi:hypothetical protein
LIRICNELRISSQNTISVTLTPTATWLRGNKIITTKFPDHRAIINYRSEVSLSTNRTLVITSKNPAFHLWQNNSNNPTARVAFPVEQRRLQFSFDEEIVISPKSIDAFILL